MTTKKPAKQTLIWEITLIRERGKFLGFVEAPDEKAAIEEAIRICEFTEPWQQKQPSRTARLDGCSKFEPIP